jgi:hypothetical protein
MKLHLILLLSVFSCTPNYHEYDLLGELKDDKGRLIKKAEAGWRPGEDNWLTITRFDTLGNVTDEYGAKPYGHKYKETFKYDNKSRVTENWVYTYESKDNLHVQFENYGRKDYELKDTLVDWSGQLEWKVLFSYDDKNKVTRERRFYIELDSLTNKEKELLTLDTLYRSDKTDSLKEEK